MGAESQQLPVTALWMSWLRGAGEVEVGKGGEGVAVSGDDRVSFAVFEGLLADIVYPGHGEVSGEKPDLIGFVGKAFGDVVSRVVTGPAAVPAGGYFSPDGVVVTPAQLGEQCRLEMIAGPSDRVAGIALQPAQRRDGHLGWRADRRVPRQPRVGNARSDRVRGVTRWSTVGAGSFADHVGRCLVGAQHDLGTQRGCHRVIESGPDRTPRETLQSPSREPGRHRSAVHHCHQRRGPLGGNITPASRQDRSSNDFRAVGHGSGRHPRWHRGADRPAAAAAPRKQKVHLPREWTRRSTALRTGREAGAAAVMSALRSSACHRSRAEFRFRSARSAAVQFILMRRGRWGGPC